MSGGGQPVGERRWCKDNYAVSVKVIMPKSALASGDVSGFYRYYMRINNISSRPLQHFHLDIWHRSGIIELTVLPSHSGGHHERRIGRPHRGQSRQPASAEGAASSTS